MKKEKRKNMLNILGKRSKQYQKQIKKINKKGFEKVFLTKRGQKVNWSMFSLIRHGNTTNIREGSCRGKGRRREERWEREEGEVREKGARGEEGYQNAVNGVVIELSKSI